MKKKLWKGISGEKKDEVFWKVFKEWKKSNRDDESVKRTIVYNTSYGNTKSYIDENPKDNELEIVSFWGGFPYFEPDELLEVLADVIDKDKKEVIDTTNKFLEETFFSDDMEGIIELWGEKDVKLAKEVLYCHIEDRIFDEIVKPRIDEIADVIAEHNRKELSND